MKEKKTNKMHAVIYARFSSAKQNEQSIDAQIRVCENFAKENGFEIIEIYIDRAATGTHDRRPAFRRMMQDSASGLFQVVLVYQYDRFARNRRDSMNNKYTLKKNNVRLLSATEPEITDRPADLFLEGILDSAAEFYSRDLAQKTTRGMEENLKKGLSIGGITPFGFIVRDRRYYIEERDAKIVRFIFEQYASGETVHNIMKMLTEKNMFYRGKSFKQNTIYDLMNNRKYIGEYINPFTGDLILNMFPAIIDIETFERVQHERELNREKTKMSTNYNKDRKYILTGKLKCGYCGENMSGISGRSRNKNKYRYYRCKTPGCQKESIRKDLIENIVADQAFEYLNDAARKEFIVNDLISKFKEAIADSGLYELEQEKKELEKELKKITDAYLSATSIIQKELNARAKKLETIIHELDREILKIKILHKQELYDKEFLTTWITDILSKDNEDYKERAVNYFINTVFAFNDKVVIYLNFDNAEPITLEQALSEIEKNEPQQGGSFLVDNGGPLSRRNEPIAWINDKLMVGIIYTLKNTSIEN